MILRGCGEDMREWADGSNKLLTQEGILLEGTKCENVKSDYVPNRLGGFLDEAPEQKTEEIQQPGEHPSHPAWEGEKAGLGGMSMKQ